MMQALPPDEEQLRAWALAYLARYAPSRAQLAAHLRRRALRQAGATAKAALAGLEAAIVRVVTRCAELGLVDDRAHARARLRRLILRGAAPNRLQADLLARGLSRDLIAEELADLSAELGEAPERVAARALLRRRGLLPENGTALLPGQTERALRLLARAGFSLATARAILSEPLASDQPPPDQA